MMDNTATRFVFDRHVSIKDMSGTLRLAQLAAESLHGQDRVELEASCSLDRDERCVVIQTVTEVGRTLAAVFLGYARREFGAEAVTVVPALRSAPQEVEGVT
jgi:hypothetical protein